MKKIIMLLMTAVFFAAGTAFAWDMNQLKIHGFISQGWLKSDNNNYYFADTEDGTFQFNEMGINFSSELTDDLRIGIQFLSKDLGEFGNNDVEIDWAYGDWRFRNWLGLRAGKIKLAKGLYNQIRDVDAARACIFLPHSIYNEAYRDTNVAMTGISLYGMLPAGFEYEVQLGKMEISSDGAIAATLAKGFNMPVNDVDVESNDDTVNFQVQWTPSFASGLRIVANYLENLKFDTKTDMIEINNAVHTFLGGIEYTGKNLTLAAEYARGYSEIKSGNTVVDDPVRECFYAMASYRFVGWFEAGTYYSVLYRDADDRDGDKREAKGQLKENGWLKDAAVFTRFDINQNWIVKLEGHYIDGLAEILDETSEELSDKGFLFAVKTTFSF